MIKEIRYKNFKALRDATLPLGRFTLIVGANGTGKTTALKALELAKNYEKVDWKDVVSVNLYNEKKESVTLIIHSESADTKIVWQANGNGGQELSSTDDFSNQLRKEFREAKTKIFKEFRIFSFDADKIAERVAIVMDLQLGENGEGLAGILDQLRDNEPERFELLNVELNKWFPEYDRILFEVPHDGYKNFLLRTRFGKHKIKAENLSQGTLLAMAYLTIAYLPNPPKIVAFEEPEKGIHPRLLRNIQEAMDRLAYPENFGEKREPIQVIATTHSPYLLDLYKDRREEIVIADKDEKGVHFKRLSELPHIEEILQEQDAPLGDVWFTGVLGGVPIQP